MSPQSIRRAAKVLRREAEALADSNRIGDQLWMPKGDAIVAEARQDHDEMIDLARQLEQLAKQTASATE